MAFNLSGLSEVKDTRICIEALEVGITVWSCFMALLLSPSYIKG